MSITTQNDLLNLENVRELKGRLPNDTLKILVYARGVPWVLPIPFNKFFNYILNVNAQTNNACINLEIPEFQRSKVTAATIRIFANFWVGNFYANYESDFKMF